MKRPGMVALLAFMDAKPSENYVVIFDDLKRYARDTEFHLHLRRIMAARGAIRECLNFRFDDSPENKFMETLFAAQGELEREQNGRQVIQKMTARLEQGRWVFQAPIGYRYEKSRHGGKELVRDEPAASVIQEALEGFASGRFDNQSEVRRFLESQPLYPRGRNGIIYNSRVKELLERVVYAGYVEAPSWNIARREGKHEGIISYATYLKNQERLKLGSRAPARKDSNVDFPLRGFVVCDDCQTPLRASWSKGKTKLHPYYVCQKRCCESYGKSIRRADIEGEFESLLRELQPSPQLVGMLKAMIENAWSQKQTQAASWAAAMAQEAAAVEKQIDGIMDRLADSTNETVIAAYERRITSLEKKKLELRAKAQNFSKPKTTLANMIELSVRFISSPWILWNSGDLALRKLVLRMAFTERLPYSRSEGYRTPKTALPFRYLAAVSSGNVGMVGPAGLEPATKRL